MARWAKLKGGLIPKDLPSEGPTHAHMEGPQNRRDRIGKLGLIAKNASDLSIRCSLLSLNDRLGRIQLLAEFRCEVAEFFRVRAALLQQGL